MIIFLIFAAVFVLAVFWIPFRLVIMHPVYSIVYAVIDFYYYFKHKKYNWFEAGKLDCYAAHFGGGKTLSIVHYVVNQYNRFNNKLIWDRGQHRFVKQKIHVISNVEFTTIPFQSLTGLDQIVNLAMHNKAIDEKEGTRTVVLVVIDEASAQLNSRNFKSNIEPTFLNTLITSRHYHISILYSSQKFKLTDKLMRDVTQRVIQCKKYWRLLVQYIYDADEVEYASDPTMIRPISRTGFFVMNRDYGAYDTLAVVGQLKKSIDEGDMLSEKEILELRDNMTPDNTAVKRPSRRNLKRLRGKSA